MEGGARFRPVMVPPPLLRLPSTLGGASELGSCSSFAFDGMGVEFDSDDLSALSGGWTDGEGSVVTVGFTSAGNWASRSGDRWRTTSLLFLLDLGAAFAEAAGDGMVGDGVADGLTRWWVVMEGGRRGGGAEAGTACGCSSGVAVEAKLGPDHALDFAGRVRRGSDGGGGEGSIIRCALLDGDSAVERQLGRCGALCGRRRRVAWLRDDATRCDKEAAIASDACGLVPRSAPLLY